MRTAIRKTWLRPAILLAVLSTVSLALSIIFILRDQAHQTRQQHFSAKLEEMLSVVKDIETGYRGYVIAGSEGFLQPYEDALSVFDRTVSELKALGANAGAPAGDVDRVVAQANSKIAFGQKIVEARRAQSFEAAQVLVMTGIGKAEMDALRALINEMQARARNLAEADEASITRLWSPLAAAGLAGFLLSAGMLAMIVLRGARSNTQFRQLLNQIFENIPAGIALTDRTGRIAMANNAFATMTGVDAATLNGTLLRHVSKDLAEASAHDRRSSVSALTADSEDTAIVTSDQAVQLTTQGGQSRFVTSRAFPVTLTDRPSDEASGAGLMIVDVTRQKEWDQALQQARDEANAANQAKSTFIANMSHELRTPLTAVIGYCELLEEDMADSGHQGFLPDLGKINTNARHLLGLINDVLDLSKIEAQRMDVAPVDFTLSALLSDVENAVGSLIAKNNNKLSIVNTCGPMRLHTDDLKLRQVLLNLIGNAAKFTKDGQITITAARHDAVGLRLSVADTGIGMTTEQVENLFQRFRQADDTTTRKYGGTGLGLALSRALVTLLGGSIEVESAPGKGSSFHVTVPVIYQPPEADPAHAITDVPSDSAASERPSGYVLVVDDDPDARELLNRLLVKEGFSVAVAASGHEALAMVRARAPAAILLDVLMPGLDGWQVLQTLRGSAATRDIPVIIQTVLDEQRFAYAMGANGYLKKPVSREALGQSLTIAAGMAERGTALVVDDDPDTRAGLAASLVKDGWSVVEAQDGQSALDALERHNPALVLVDLVMPDMDGYAFIRAMRAESAWDGVPIVALTSEDLSDQKMRSLQESSAHVVRDGAKPLDALVTDLRRFVPASVNSREKNTNG